MLTPQVMWKQQLSPLGCFYVPFCILKHQAKLYDIVNTFIWNNLNHSIHQSIHQSMNHNIQVHHLALNWPRMLSWQLWIYNLVHNVTCYFLFSTTNCVSNPFIHWTTRPKLNQRWLRVWDCDCNRWLIYGCVYIHAFLQVAVGILLVGAGPFWNMSILINYEWQWLWLFMANWFKRQPD